MGERIFEEKELVVLTYGDSWCAGSPDKDGKMEYSGYIRVSTYLDIEKDKVMKLEEPVFLVWDVTSKQVEDNDLVFEFESEKLYRVIVKKEEGNVFFYLEKLIGEETSKEFEKLLKRPTGKLILKYNGRQFILDTDRNVFINISKREDYKYMITLELDVLNGNTAYKALAIWSKISKNLLRFEKRVKKYVAKEYLKVANACREEDREKKITKREFMERLKLCSINVYKDMYKFAFGTDEMFPGHLLVVEGNLKGFLSVELIG